MNNRIRNLTKIIIAAIIVVAGFLTNPSMQSASAAIYKSHPTIASVAGAIVAIAATLHNPSTKA